MPCASCGHNTTGFNVSKSTAMILGNVRNKRSGKSKNIIRSRFGVVSRSSVSNGKKFFLLG